MDETVRGLGPSDDDVLVEIREIALRCAAEVVDRETASDVAMDVVVLCLTRMRAKRWRVEHRALHGYVCRLARDRVVDVLREQHRRREREAEHARDRRESAHEWMYPERALEAKELDAASQKEFDGLPQQARLTWMLVREQRISYKSVAKALGLSHRAIRANLARAERLVRERMREKGLADAD